MINSERVSRVRFGFLDLAVVIALLRVITLHSLNNYRILTAGTPLTFIDSPLWQQLSMILLRFSVPVFVAASGFKYALSLHRHPHRTGIAYITDRARRLLRPFLIWSSLSYLLLPLVTGTIPHGMPAYASFPDLPFSTVAAIFSGAETPAYPLWFIPMLMVMTCVYPPIFHRTSARISQPLLWGLFLTIRFYHLPLPWMYPAYLAFYDLGARLGTSAIPGPMLRRRMMAPAAATAAVALIIAASRFLTQAPPVQETALMLQEIFVPIAIFLGCAVLLPGPSPRWLRELNAYVWPVFLIHEPLILGRIGFLTYITFDGTSPGFIPAVIIGTLLTASIFYHLLRRAGLQSLLF
ncbi:MAG TPA: acyltransferase [bacterium]|nr:acyltransferase [bacterium]